jgi:hypothetical protein
MGMRRTNNKSLPSGPLVRNRRKPEPRRKRIEACNAGHVPMSALSPAKVKML